MEISFTEQSVVFLFSCVVGGLLGAFYDVFRIVRIAFRSKWLSIFFQDLIFCIFSAFSIILLVFYTNSGTVRWFSLFGCFLCFVLYHLTVGRLIMFVSKKIIDFIKKVLKFLYSITIMPLKMTVLLILKQIKRLCKLILKTFKLTKSYLYFIGERHRMKKSASRGFKLYKNIKNIRAANGKTAKNLVKIIEKDSVKKQKSIKKSKKKI